MADGELGTWIREGRKTKCWTQTDIGKMLGVSQVRISQRETGKKVPDAEELRQLEVAFGQEAPVTSSRAAPPVANEKPRRCRRAPAKGPAQKKLDLGTATTGKSPAEPALPMNDGTFEKRLWAAADELRDPQCHGMAESAGILDSIIDKRRRKTAVRRNSAPRARRGCIGHGRAVKNPPIENPMSVSKEGDLIDA